VLDVKTGAKLKEIIASDETDPAKSGLAMINGWVDSPAKDNSTRHVYAGDMEGHVWRFDLVDGTATLLATIGKVVGASTQPITTKPELGEVPEEGLTQRVIYVGTGRYYGISDITDNSMQSFYAIRDDAANLKSWGNFRADPTVVAMDLTGGAGSRNLTYSAVAAADAGWYVDFDAENGERVTVNPRLSFGYLTVLTNVPSEDLCVIGGTSWAYFFDAYPSKAGAAPAGTIAFVGNALAVGASGIVLPSGKQVTIANLADGTNVSITNQPTTSSGTLKRVTWRELIN
jgi:type IV pilus assembly protein PilY1